MNNGLNDKQKKAIDVLKAFELNYDDRFRYQMLDRMRSDCEYFLGFGYHSTNRLWVGNVEDQIAVMKALYHSFSDEDKPQWITIPEIEKYQKEMMMGNDMENILNEGTVVVSNKDKINDARDR